MAVGLITGLLGSISTNLFAHFRAREERKRDKDRYAHEEKSWEHEVKLLELQSQAKVAETEQEVILATTHGSYEGLKVSYENQNIMAKNSHKITNTVLAFVRPLITACLLYITIKSGLASLEVLALAENLNVQNDGLIAIVKSVYQMGYDHPALSVIYGLTEMSVAWWFGDRSTKRALQHSQMAGQVRAAGGNF